MGGRGASSGGGMTWEQYSSKVKALQKDIKSASAQTTKARKAYYSASGAAIAFDWHGESPSSDNPRYKQYLEDQKKAKQAYDDALKKEDGLRKELDRTVSRYQKQSGAKTAQSKLYSNKTPRDVTTSTYEKAQKNLQKQVDAWFGNRR